MATATGREHDITCRDSAVSQIFIVITSNGEKILSKCKFGCVKTIKRENSSLPIAIYVSKMHVLEHPIK